MKPVNSVADDMFERAREAFFGTANNAPKPAASSADVPKPRSEARPKEVTGSSSDRS
jgi:hypothetical protein